MTHTHTLSKSFLSFCNLLFRAVLLIQLRCSLINTEERTTNRAIHLMHRTLELDSSESCK